MKPLSRTFLFALSLLAFLSCEQRKVISVTVVDKVTRKPIDSVFVEINAGTSRNSRKNHSQDYTNSLGKLELRMMIGCSFGCYDIYMDYSKPGYQKKSEMNRTTGIVELEK